MRRGRVRAIAAAALAGVSLTGCGLRDEEPNLANGKELFLGEGQCAACHTLERAGAQGVIGPNLDEAWQQADKDGLGRSTYEGLVEQQILYPNKNPQVDPTTDQFNKDQIMPPKLVTGQDAKDVAAYVAMAAAAGGEDPGLLAQIGQGQSNEVAQADGGTLDIPVSEERPLAYEFAAAEAPAGTLTINSPNPDPVPHNIAVDGNGVDEKGPVVQDGGVSTIEVELEAGEYEFYCSVPGHREGGMAGKLTVE